ALAGRIDGARIERADAGFVRDATGFAIGGVAPVGHATPPHVVIDRDLLALPRIWAAAGTPNSVFALTPEQLVALTGGVVADIAKRAP
ncbi:YbaK/EbsC family protein, partial [Inquilinus sp. CA228]|uniref:YbaK/EbsC family protein n=1 Tax=Inquilinus sp. CA228 TaxID=3455609 RepID=UPI003F8D843D